MNEEEFEELTQERPTESLSQKDLIYRQIERNSILLAKLDNVAFYYGVLNLKVLCVNYYDEEFLKDYERLKEKMKKDFNRIALLKQNKSHTVNAEIDTPEEVQLQFTLDLIESLMKMLDRQSFLPMKARGEVI